MSQFHLSNYKLSRALFSQWRQPYFPFLFVLFPILTSYIYNLNELTIETLLVPLAAVTVATCVLYFLARMVVTNWTKAGLLVSLVMLPVINYAALVGWYGNQFIANKLPLNPHQAVVALSALIVLGVGWWLRRTSRSMLALSPILNVLAVVLVAQVVWQVAWSQVMRYSDVQPALAQTSSITIAQQTSTLGYNPDVYYIIFDRYANEHTLTDDYGFDNSAFLNTLKDQGFYVASQSATNYPYTPLSLSSSLNMTYQRVVPINTSPYPELATQVYPKLQDTQVDDVFHDLGYKVYQMGSWFSPTHTNSAADGNYVLKNVMDIDDFSNQLLAGTMLAPVLEKTLTESERLSASEQNLNNFIYQTDNFSTVAHLAGPKFVFMHMLMPHSPYVVDAQCAPLADGVADNRLELTSYLAQLQCANKQALSMVQTIMQSSKQKPIIIFQSDEGPYTIRYPMPDSIEFAKASNDSILERTRILNAYYLPDNNTSQLYQTISPVNSFRMLFRTYFNLDFPQLADQTYVSPSRGKLMSFMNVTDIIAQGWSK
jgi:hypothetical protein